QRAERPRAHPEARALERDRTSLHRRAHDARPAGRRRAGDGGRRRRTHRDARRIALRTPGALVAARSWEDYSIGRDDAIAHLGALDLVYSGVIADHRTAIDKTEETDPVTQDLLISQAGELEQYHWFVRAHLENADGSLRSEGAKTEKEAAEAATD